MTMTDTAPSLEATKAQADKLFRGKQLFAYSVPAVVFVYFVYVFFAFDIMGLAKRASWDNAVTLAADSWSYKVHVTRQNRTGEVEYAVEGERKGAYPEGERPDWVSGDDVIVVDLGEGNLVRLLPDNVTEVEVPGYGVIEAQAEGRQITTNLEDTSPDWISASNRRVAITLEAGRVSITGTKTEVFNYFPGWELFWFTFDSPYHGQSFGKIFFGEQIDPTRGNIAGAAYDWWHNEMWRHKDVA